MMDDNEFPVTPPSSRTSSLGSAVSGRGQSGLDEEDMLYYIPERRPSLDLGPVSMDTSQWHYVDKAFSPAVSYRSMTSDEISISLNVEDGSPTRVELNRADSYSSCYSLDSDDCEKLVPKIKEPKEPKEDLDDERSDTSDTLPEPDLIRNPSLTVAFTFTAISKTLRKLSERDLKEFKMRLWKRYPQSFNTYSLSMDVVDLVDRLLECFSLDVSLHITKVLLEEIGQNKMINYLHTLCIRNEVRHDLSETLKVKYGQDIDNPMQGEKRPLDEVFTDLYITSTSDNGPNIEHEVMTIGKLNSITKKEKLLSTKDILSAERLECSHLKLLLLSGVPGSGKSTAVRRLILDWIEGKSHQHVSLLFPLMFRELKQFEDSSVSLMEILQTLYPETKKLREEDYRGEDCKIMFIFDGLDEYSSTLDFHNSCPLTHFTESTSMNAIVVNLLRDKLFYQGLFLVTSRTQLKRSIPWDTHYDKIDVRGFLDPQKNEYFRKRFKDPAQAAQVIAYIDASRTLRIMCHLPLFCSLVGDEFQHIFMTRGAQPPRSIAYMYTKLLSTLTRERRKLRASDLCPDKEREFFIKLGNLAFNMLEQGQFKITRYEWKDLGISAEEAVINSGLCTQYLTCPIVLHQENVISFIHPTMQEYMAALYVFLTFTNLGKNIFVRHVKDKVKGFFKVPTVMELYKSAVDRSLQHEDGKLDTMTRFLVGMGLETNLELLQPLCTGPVKWPTFAADAADLIRERIKGNVSQGRKNHLIRCLDELR
ncbi:NLR family CARD domain-containing protein 3 [Pungitius pungitius]|uniref:NLR family CARD domain-containing protein 3 n=1 Tax=Pungitius pungitius TaxID=134920 RepID=UPI002E0D16E5